MKYWDKSEPTDEKCQQALLGYFEINLGIEKIKLNIDKNYSRSYKKLNYNIEYYVVIIPFLENAFMLY